MKEKLDESEVFLADVVGRMLCRKTMSIVTDSYLHGITRLAVKRARASEIAKAVGLTKARIGQWRRVDDKYLAEVSRLSGIPTWALRPDIAATMGLPKLDENLEPWLAEVSDFLASNPVPQQATAA